MVLVVIKVGLQIKVVQETTLQMTETQKMMALMMSFQALCLILEKKKILLHKNLQEEVIYLVVQIDLDTQILDLMAL